MTIYQYDKSIAQQREQAHLLYVFLQSKQCKLTFRLSTSLDVGVARQHDEENMSTLSNDSITN